MTKSTGYNISEYKENPFMNNLFDTFLNDGVSIMALDAKNDNKLIGIRLSFVVERVCLLN